MALAGLGWERQFVVWSIKGKTWIGLKPFAAIFQELFQSFGAGHVKIISMGDWIGENWSWNFSDSSDNHTEQTAEQLLYFWDH